MCQGWGRRQFRHCINNFWGHPIKGRGLYWNWWSIRGPSGHLLIRSLKTKLWSYECLNSVDISLHLHSGQKCFIRVACLWSKMPMLQRAGMREGGEPLPLAFQYLIPMIWRPCDLNLVMISSMASKCQDFKHRGLQFYFIKSLKNGQPKFQVLAFWSHWRYHDQI